MNARALSRQGKVVVALFAAAMLATLGVVVAAERADAVYIKSSNGLSLYMCKTPQLNTRITVKAMEDRTETHFQVVAVSSSSMRWKYGDYKPFSLGQWSGVTLSVPQTGWVKIWVNIYNSDEGKNEPGVSFGYYNVSWLPQQC